MAQDRYEFHLRPDGKKAAIAEIAEQDDNFQLGFYDFCYATSQHGWDQRERLETLDGRYQTYVLPIAGDRTRRAMLTREVGTRRYCFLGLTLAVHNVTARAQAYTQACKAHGLDAPTREPNPQGSN